MPMSKQPQSQIEIFRAGTHQAANGTTYTITADELIQCVQAYDPARADAPIVVGHPAIDAPAYGWVDGLSVNQDGTLIATLKDVEPQFAELVRNKRYKKISAAFYPKNHPSSPNPAALYLKHVGFLGAAAPAVKGLKPAEFADSTDCLIFEFSETETVALPEPEAALPNHPPNPSLQQQESVMPDPKKTELEAREAALAAREAAFEQHLAKTHRAEVQAFTEKLAAEGRILPRQQTALIEFLCAIPDDATLNFSEDGANVNKPSLTWFKTFLSELPVAVEFAEKSAPENEDPKKFKYKVVAPEGYSTDPKDAAKMQSIMAYAETHGLDFASAAVIIDQQQRG